MKLISSLGWTKDDWKEFLKDLGIFALGILDLAIFMIIG